MIDEFRLWIATLIKVAICIEYHGEEALRRAPLRETDLDRCHIKAWSLAKQRGIEVHTLSLWQFH